MSHPSDALNGPIVDPDAALAAAAKQGDLDAFEALVARYQKRMLNIAFRITGDHDEACEVAQDALLAAFRGLAGFRGESRFSTWLTSITVNRSRNRLKQLKVRRSRVPYSIDAPLRTGDGELLPDPASEDPSVLDRMEQRDLSASVRDCIQALELPFREVIVLRDLQDMAYEEISAALSLAAGTVKSRLFRAREAVKECLKKAMGGL